MDLKLDLDNVLKHFDRLVAEGTIVYDYNYETVRITDNGLPFEFRILSGMSQKPSYSNADGSTMTAAEIQSDKDHEKALLAKGCAPGSDINVSGYEVGHLTETGHILAFNKFPAARPHFLILTADAYQRQFERLDGNDLWAMWSVMRSLGDGEKARHISFFNCGLESGCSRLHKHMQVFAITSGLREGEESKLWPDVGEGAFFDDVLPFKVAIARFDEEDSKKMTKDRLLEVYGGLVAEAEGYLGVCTAKEKNAAEVVVNGNGTLEDQHGRNGEPAAAIPHNVVLDERWMVVIPRRSAGWKGADSNAVSMLGMHWVSGQEKIDRWVGLGPTEVMRQVGVPVRE
ncbi:hypothetical protein QBC37DRAFT_475683 [Rhypophila decipiens]|uniref:ATP adenylyltransferase n=1 Tax=Rhypophila decipiens TaxID=261697 RepID=A0AAN6Y0I9_9PEZI|nr:hypothetical protein QBC37DRAFT_475683 [Rhypophila decipiens]